MSEVPLETSPQKESWRQSERESDIYIYCIYCSHTTRERQRRSEGGGEIYKLYLLFTHDAGPKG